MEPALILQRWPRGALLLCERMKQVLNTQARTTHDTKKTQPHACTQTFTIANKLPRMYLGLKTFAQIDSRGTDGNRQKRSNVCCVHYIIIYAIAHTQTHALTLTHLLSLTYRHTHPQAHPQTEAHKRTHVQPHSHVWKSSPWVILQCSDVRA